MPAFSFGGARYDFKDAIFPVLIELDSIRLAIKEGTSYMDIATGILTFLDVAFFIAPGFIPHDLERG